MVDRNITTLLTVRQFSERHPAFSQGSLRYLIFQAKERPTSAGVIPGNGLVSSGALIRVGRRRVLLDEQRFLEWVRAQQEGVHHAG